MEHIYSKLESDLLLATVVRFQDFTLSRRELVAPEEFIQGAMITADEGDKFRPHRHIIKPFVSCLNIDDKYAHLAQEAWIVITGSIKIVIYDTDLKVIYTSILTGGDACVLLYGGHSFECIEDNTCLYELKTGPYTGQKNDKVFINE
jgi:hypothetical protein